MALGGGSGSSERMAEASPAVFFDLGGTLASPRLSPPPVRLEGLTAYPFVAGVLAELCDAGARLGMISNTGDESGERLRQLLAAAGLYEPFDERLLVFSSVVGMEKDSTEIFELAAERAGLASRPARCLFVGEDSRERQLAHEAGFRVCPHPLLALEVLRGAVLRFARLRAPAGHEQSRWREFLRRRPIVPLGTGGDGGATVHAIVPQSAVPRLVDGLFEVELLGRPDAPLLNDLYLLRDDLAAGAGFLAEAGQSSDLLTSPETADLLLSSSREGLVVQLPPDRSAEDFHFEKSHHGHNLKLTADPFLLAPFGSGAGERAAVWLAADAVPPSLTAAEKAELATITPQVIEQHLDRYSGNQPLGDSAGTPIDSRHIASPDNARASSQLALDLEQIGGGDFSVSMHPFTHEGRTLLNVVADLPGSSSNEWVLVTAHHDSTAGFSHPYDPVADPAPGADDDGSGLAAVLAIAESLHRLAAAARPARGLRFALFNAEEHGLVGSRAYAHDVAAAGAAIVAVFQLDMIGYNVVAPRSYEVHAGYGPSSEVETRSLALAERVRQVAAVVSPALSAAQVYPAAAGQSDPAAGRSDHFAFQQHGYAACAATEDFFAGPAAGSPAPEGNPNYHRKTDTFVDLAYAADIARGVAAAAWLTALPERPSEPRAVVDPTPWLSLLLTDEPAQLSPGALAPLLE